MIEIEINNYLYGQYFGRAFQILLIGKNKKGMKGSRYAIIKLVESSNFVSTINLLINDKKTRAKITEYDN